MYSLHPNVLWFLGLIINFYEELQDEFWCFNPEYPVNPVNI